MQYQLTDTKKAYYFSIHPNKRRKMDQNYRKYNIHDDLKKLLMSIKQHKGMNKWYHNKIEIEIKIMLKC